MVSVSWLRFTDLAILDISDLISKYTILLAYYLILLDSHVHKRSMVVDLVIESLCQNRRKLRKITEKNERDLFTCTEIVWTEIM